MNKTIALVGASGVLGQEILALLARQSYHVRSIIRDENKRSKVAPCSEEVWIADARHPEEIAGCFSGIDIVISTVGKSVSLFTQEPSTFFEVDYQANLHLLQEAQRAQVKHFTYVSIFASEISPTLRQGWMQERFSRTLMQSGLSYTVIKPVGLFSGLHDLIIMGKKGLILTPGDGEAKTNPIHQRDLAQFCVEHLETLNAVLPVGGPETHTRKEVADLVCQHTRCPQSMLVPLPLIKLGLPIARLFNQNLYDKLAFFTYITTHDMIAPPYGHHRFKDYLVAELEHSS